jgi:propanol-preferring alcohol dehydrogenase
MAERMDCLRIEAWGGDLQRATVPVPSVGVNEVLVEVEATGVGRTVHNYVQGNMGDDPADLPRIPGHEVVGTVAETGEGVTHLEDGDLVTAYFHIGCGQCRYCHAGLQPLCEHHGGHVGVKLDGGFAEFVALPVGQVIPLPGELDPVGATTIPDAIATPYHVAKERASITPGDHVAVLGAGGGVGIHLVQVAQVFGADVTAVDLDGRKLDVCRDVGATHGVNARDRDPEAALAEPGLAYDAVVDFTGDTDLLEAAVSHLAPRGVLVNLTSFPDNAMRLPPRSQVRNETAVVGSRYCSKDELRDAAALVAAGEVEPIVSSTVGFDGVPDLLETIVANELVGRGAMTPT